jgi:NitT/TauT family transport system substrate-binding protein
MQSTTQTRRRFLASLSAAGTTGLIDPPVSFAQERPPETTTVRVAKIAGICIAPQYVAEDLLRAEGFTDIRYVATNPGIPAALSLARGEVDFTANYAPTFVIPIDAGEPITIVGGEHIGCFELFAREGIRSILDLKGKNVGVLGFNTSQHIFVSIMAAQVGLVPTKDIH